VVCDPRIGWGLVFPLLLRAVGAGRLGLLVTIAVAIVWLLFRKSYITLDSQGFTYHSVARHIVHAWIDVERFCVVEQRMYAFIVVNRYLGWNYSPAYKNYKRLAIPRTVARWVGMSDAMFKPVGFDVRKLTTVMNEYLRQARTGNIEKPATVSPE
jgi:hypothetical protein